ncbi:hypothetical protein BJF84_04070 [Rhodococcus sp. CUA-806]|nr:hypothetical protein BJF84_04070 [Rhodococcus sp. CUA-806]
MSETIESISPVAASSGTRSTPCKPVCSNASRSKAILSSPQLRGWVIATAGATPPCRAVTIARRQLAVCAIKSSARCPSTPAGCPTRETNPDTEAAPVSASSPSRTVPSSANASRHGVSNTAGSTVASRRWTATAVSSSTEMARDPISGQCSRR